MDAPSSRGVGAKVLPSDTDVYVDEPWLHMHWDRSHKCVISVWKGFANSAEFRAALEKGLQAIRERHAIAYVSDTRKIKVIVHEDQAWANETLIPQMAAAGLKRLAMVTADAGLGKVTVEEIVKLVDNRPLLMRSFDSVPAAMRWVKEA
jgi:tRNA A-37 threonylcarbamoyl transferase component Bud32